MALASGLLASFLGDADVRLTIRGRRRSPRFEFDFRCPGGNVALTVDGVQIEVDSGLEGAGIHLVEGKLGVRDNFHIRQLYYPLRMWNHEVPGKPANAVFMSWSNRRFALRKYAFNPVGEYHAISLTDATDYVLDEEDERPTLAALVDDTKERPLPSGVPFPQADDLRKVIDVVDAVGVGLHRQSEIAERHDFDKRQADYYGNAAVFLGLLRRDTGGFFLSGLGEEFVTRPLPIRNIIVAQQVASAPVFRSALIWVIEHGELPATDRVVEWIGSATSLTGLTPRRRAMTVLSWSRWVADTFGAL